MQGVVQCVLQVVFQGGAVCVLLVLECLLECVLQGVLQRGTVCRSSGVAVFVAGCVAGCNAGCGAVCVAGCIAVCCCLCVAGIAVCVGFLAPLIVCTRHI